MKVSCKISTKINKLANKFEKKKSRNNSDLYLTPKPGINIR